MMSTMGSESPDNWQFYALHECIPGHEITTDVDSLISTCVYDADYYDARWQYEAPTCVGKQKIDINFFKLVFFLEADLK